jgi:hypothetical protein
LLRRRSAPPTALPPYRAQEITPPPTQSLRLTRSVLAIAVALVPASCCVSQFWTSVAFDGPHVHPPCDLRVVPTFAAMLAGTAAWAVYRSARPSMLFVATCVLVGILAGFVATGWSVGAAERAWLRDCERGVASACFEAATAHEAGTWRRDPEVSIGEHRRACALGERLSCRHLLRDHPGALPPNACDPKRLCAPGEERACEALIGPCQDALRAGRSGLR